ncbi:MAG: RNA-directed DNA polymerase [Actinomycetota bacterium]
MITERSVPVRIVRARGRELVVLHPTLAARYVSLVAAVAPAVEARLPASVAANRLAAAGVDPPTLRLAPWRAERESFADRLARLLADARCVVVADVRACYGSISPRVAREALIGLGCRGGDALAVQAFLARLIPLGVRGLPVGPDPSAVLANAVLSTADRALAVAGVRHLRWVDDVVATVDGPRDAERLLAVLRRALGRLGLELNEAKTRIVREPSILAEATTVSIARAGGLVG